MHHRQTSVTVNGTQKYGMNFLQYRVMCVGRKKRWRKFRCQHRSLQYVDNGFAAQCMMAVLGVKSLVQHNGDGWMS